MRLGLLRRQLIELDGKIFRWKIFGRDNDDIYIIEDWGKELELLRLMQQIPFLKNNVESILDMGTYLKLEDRLHISIKDYPTFNKEYEQLRERCSAVIDMLDSYDESDENELLIKLPTITNLSDLGDIIHNFNRAITQCPLFDSTMELKFKRLETGSDWIIIIPAAAVSVSIAMLNISKFLKISAETRKIHHETEGVKLDNIRKWDDILNKTKIKEAERKEIREAILRTAQKEGMEFLRKDLLERGKEINPGKVLINEEVERLVLSFKTMWELFARGLEVYPSISASDEVKQDFPFQEDVRLLKDIPSPPEKLPEASE